MITLAEAKEHLRIDHDDQDTLLSSQIAAATEYLAKLGCNTDVDPIPAPVRQAGILIVAALYDGNEDILKSPMRMRQLAVDTLTAPYRELSL